MKLAIAGVLCAALFMGSCIFQNTPLGPNQPPLIQSYTPDSTVFTLIAPDSCWFTIRAVDPDGDEIRYVFKLGDSILGTNDSVQFYAGKPGGYDIRAEACDGSTRAYHDWRVNVVKKDSAPPRITYWLPEQALVACAVGDTLEFHFSAEDDHIEAVSYSYLLDSTLISSGSSHLMYRFMERGDFLLEGVAWDGQNGDTVSWNLTVTGYPDTTKPAAIVDLVGGPGDIDGTILLEWTAPGDDEDEGRAASYIVRTSTYPIITEHDWEEAEGKIGEPVPSPAGSRERMTIWNLSSASYVYVMMRGVDDFFNRSPLGNCVRVLVRGIDIGGYVRNAATNGAIEGCPVFAGYYRDSSAVDGGYLLQNIPSYATSVGAKDENVSGQPGDYYDVTLQIGIITQYVRMDFFMIPVFGLVNTVGEDQYQGRFLAFFKEITRTNGELGRPTIFKGWNHWPITVYSPPQVFQGFNLQDSARVAMAEWESLTGLDLFIEAAQPQNADAFIIYDSTTLNRHHVVTAALNADGTPARREIWICLQNTEVPMVRFSHMVFAHELGHVLGLDHSRNTGHLLVGGTTPQVDHATLDEIRVLQIIYHMPNIFNYRNVAED